MKSHQRYPTHLLERDAVLLEAAESLSASPGHRRILVVSGARGAGKSALINAVGEAARRERSRRVVEIPCISFSSRNVDTLFGLIEELRRSCSSSRTPVEAERLPSTVASADHEGGTYVAKQKFTTVAPVVLLLDDLHLLDHGTLERVAFAIKSAAHDIDLRCIATTLATVPPSLWREFSFHVLSPLSEAGSLALLRQGTHAILPAHRRHIIDRAEGNPLAVIELARVGASPTSTELVPVPPITDVLADAGTDLHRVPHATRTILRHVLRESIGRVADNATSATGAMSVGLPAGPEGRIDSLTKLSVHAASSLADRMSIHHELSRDTALSASERLLHRALACTVAEEDVVDQLEDFADDLILAGCYRTATLVLCQASRISRETERAAAILIRAASAASFAGYFDLSESVYEELAYLPTHVRHSSDTAASGTFCSVMRGGDLHVALDRALRALDHVPEGAHPDIINQLIASSFAYGVAVSDLDAIDRSIGFSVKYDQILDPVNVLISRTLSMSAAVPLVRALDQRSLQGSVLASLRTREPWKTTLLYLALPILLLHPAEGAWLASDTGIQTSSSPIALTLDKIRAAAVRAAGGELGIAASSAGGDSNICGLDAGPFRLGLDAFRTLLCTLRGVDIPAESAARYDSDAITIGLVSRCRFEVAYQRMRNHDLSPVRWVHSAYGPLEMLDFVECCIRMRRSDEALEYLARVGASRPDFWSERHTALLNAATAIVAPQGNSALFETALLGLRHGGWIFDLPRVALAYGEWLRRHHRVLDSRTQLAYAADAFSRLGAIPWVRRTEDELRAAGSSQREQSAIPFSELTTQEHRIAALAASGLTNKQIGQELYLSARTVSGHLYRVFPKLQITKRSALRDALIRYDERTPTVESIAPLSA